MTEHTKNPCPEPYKAYCSKCDKEAIFEVIEKGLVNTTLSFYCDFHYSYLRLERQKSSLKNPFALVELNALTRKLGELVK